MKRFLLLTVFSLMVGICSAYDFSAVSPSGHTLYYDIDGSNVKITSELAVQLASDVYNTLPTGDIVIPESVSHDGVTYTVTTIGDCAFLNCLGVTNISIPATVTTIESNALAGCSGIKNLVVPATVTTIGDNAFRFVRHVDYNGPAWDEFDWNALSVNGVVDGNLAYPDESKTQLNACLDADADGTVTIPASVKVISAYAFAEIHNLLSIDVPNTVDSIGVGAFEGCENLVSATLPAGLKMINAFLFTGCKSLKSFVVPDSVEIIYILAFANCSALSEVTFGYSLEEIVGTSFNKCTNLKKINSLAPVAPQLLNGDPFGKVKKDEVEVTVPGGCMESYKENWTSFSNFKEVWNPKYNVFPYTHEGQTLYFRLKTDTLRNQTYAICSYPVLFPTSAETVWEGYEKPKGDVNIPSTVEYNGQAYSVADVGRCVFIYCDSITSINVPENVFKLGNGSMAYCSNLKTVKLPSTLTEIDRLAFINDSLETIVLACTIPPMHGDTVFTAFDATLYVPAGTADAYRQHEVWGLFTNIVEGDLTGINALKDDDVKIYARNGRIVVDGTDGENVQVFNIHGQEIPSIHNSLPNGIYLVKVANRPAQKVSVRM